MTQLRSVLATALLLLTGLAPASAAPAQQASGTATPVKELATLLAAKSPGAGPRFIAAEDPTDKSRFVAAMLLPDLQLLVVAAAYETPVLLRERVLTGKYRDAYQDLQAASIPDGKVVIEDVRADGLVIKPGKGQAADQATIADKTVAFDGQWRKARLKEDEYTAAFADAEQRYERLLGLLIAQARAN